MKAAVFSDQNENLGRLLAHWGLDSVGFASSNSLLASKHKFDVVVIRAGNDGWRLATISDVVHRWPQAIIIVMSGGNYKQVAMEAGANEYFQDGQQRPEEFKALLEKHHLIP